MLRVALLLVVVGCTTHHHVTAGPTTSAVNGTVGGEITGEATSGDRLVLIAGATARSGHGITGGAVRVGIGIEETPETPDRVFAEDPEPSKKWSPLNLRAAVTVGPTFYSDDGAASKFEARGALAVAWSFARSPAKPSGFERRMTLGIELFASTIGARDPDVLVGLGITVGAWEYGTLAIAASRPTGPWD